MFLISTSDSSNLQIVHNLVTSRPELFSHTVLLNPVSDLSTAIQIVGRVLKSAGTNLGMLLLDEGSGGNVITAMQEYELFGAGFAYVSLQETAWGVMERGVADGFICVGDEELAGAKNREEFEIGLFLSQIAALDAAEKEGIVSPAALKSHLIANYNGKSRNATAF